ncbi:MAG: hypothetical protein ABSG25_06095 [Bryobacteraceae bacterium]
MNTQRPFYFALSLALFLPVAGLGQTTVEYGSATGGSSTGAAGTGKTIGGIFGKANNALGASAAPANSSKPVAPAVSDKTAPEKSGVASPTPTPVQLGTACIEDPSKVTTGLDYQTVLDRCGIPATTSVDEENVQTLLYTSKDKEVVVKIAAKKVTAVSVSGKKRESAEFVILQ